jgi:hypothetical protein
MMARERERVRNMVVVASVDGERERIETPSSP